MYHLSCAHRWFQHRATGSPARALPQVQGAVRHGSDGHHLPRRPSSRRGGHADPSRARQDPRRRRASPPRVPLRSRRHDRRRQPRRRRDVRADLRSRRPERARGLLPSEVASRCVALGERVAALREETRALAAEANDARRRAREAEDAAAAAELATDDADALREELAGTKHELHAAIHQRDAAAFSERTCKAKTLRAQEELSERQNELQRLRGKVQALETQRKLERDLAEGRVVGEEDLIRRFRGEVAADPRRAVETLCRSLAGKNRQLHQQVEEYNKLATRLREKERALAAAEVAATAAGANASRITRGRGRGNRPRPAISPVARVRSADAPRAGGVATTTTRGTPRTRLCFLARGRRRPNARDATRISPTSRTSSVSATRRDAVAMERFASRGGTGGPLSRAAPARGDGSGLGFGSGSLRSGSSSNGGAADQGENLLDDILEEIDAKTNAKTSANDTSASASHANGASASASRPSTLRVPAGAASFARRGVGGGVGDDARAEFESRGGTRATGKFVLSTARRRSRRSRKGGSTGRVERPLEGCRCVTRGTTRGGLKGRASIRHRSHPARR